MNNAARVFKDWIWGSLIDKISLFTRILTTVIFGYLCLFVCERGRERKTETHVHVVSCGFSLPFYLVGVCFLFFPLLFRKLCTVFSLEACQNHRSWLINIKVGLEELGREKAKAELGALPQASRRASTHAQGPNLCPLPQSFSWFLGWLLRAVLRSKTCLSLLWHTSEGNQQPCSLTVLSKVGQSPAGRALP